MRPQTLLVFSAALVLLSACAGGAQRPTGAVVSGGCFSSANIRAWRAVDARTLIVRATRDRFYRLQLTGVCPELIVPDARLTTTFNGDYQVCSALDWHLAVSAPGVPVQTCPVLTMTRLTATQLATLPKDERP